MWWRAVERMCGLSVYPASVCERDGVRYCLGRRGAERFLCTVGQGPIRGQKAGELEGRPVILAPAERRIAEALRSVFPWCAPRLIGLAPSIGLGDRLGLATPGHIRAVRGSGLACVLAQQSIREMARTGRTPRDVMDDATWGVFQEGFREGFGSDADHLQRLEDVDHTVPAGFTMYTIDPGEHVDDGAEAADAQTLRHRYERLDFEGLETSPGELRRAYVGRSFPLVGGGEVDFDEEAFLRAAVKYGGAIAHTVRMSRRLAEAVRGPLELEVSVDETESPTTPAEHYFLAAEMRRLGVQWVSLAPRFVGRFEKGVDYIGPLDGFRRAFARHVAVMRTLGPYKLSVHSGSDKFSIYPVVAELSDGLFHVKTAGTSYLAALEVIARVEPGLFREILDFARERYEADKATYHVSADVRRVPPADALKDAELPELVHEFHARQVLHVTFGSVLTADGGRRFAGRIRTALNENEELHYGVLAERLGHHVALLTGRPGGR